MLNVLFAVKECRQRKGNKDKKQANLAKENFETVVIEVNLVSHRKD